MKITSIVNIVYLIKCVRHVSKKGYSCRTVALSMVRQKKQTNKQTNKQKKRKTKWTIKSYGSTARKDMDVNEHERLSNITLRHKVKYRNGCINSY